MFNESNTVEAFVRDRLIQGRRPRTGTIARRVPPSTRWSLPRSGDGADWEFIAISDLNRSSDDVLTDAGVRDSLVGLNPEIAAQPDRADEVIYKLRAILLSVRTDGLVRANEEFATWLRGERSMPFGPNGQHVPVRLIDFDDLSNNRYVVTTQLVYKAGPERRFDLVLFVNGIPLVVGEAKTPVRPAVSWVDGAAQLHDDYEVNVPGFFVPNVFSFATEGRTFRFGSIGMPLEKWAPWRDTEGIGRSSEENLARAYPGRARGNTSLEA